MLYRKTAIALAAALTLAASAASPASARGWHHHGGWGWGGAAAGFATGALIGGALASRPYYGYAPYGYYDEPVVVDDGYAAAPGGSDQYCAQRYRSYDPRTGTFMGYDGVRHPCP
jgi:hypothetical protein